MDGWPSSQKEIAAQVGEERDDDDNISVIACTTAKRARGTLRATGGGARVGTAKVTGQNGSESELRHEGTRQATPDAKNFTRVAAAGRGWREYNTDREGWEAMDPRQYAGPSCRTKI